MLYSDSKLHLKEWQSFHYIVTEIAVKVNRFIHIVLINIHLAAYLLNIQSYYNFNIFYRIQLVTLDFNKCRLIISEQLFIIATPIDTFQTFLSCALL